MTGLLKRRWAGQGGFTMVEILVVIAVLGLLAAIIIPNLTSFIGDGDEAAMETELRSVQTAVAAYVSANAGDLPAADPESGGVITDAINPYLRGGDIGDVSYPTYNVSASGLVTRS